MKKLLAFFTQSYIRDTDVQFLFQKVFTEATIGGVL